MRKCKLRIVTDYSEGYENDGYWENDIIFENEKGFLKELKRLGYTIPKCYTIENYGDSLELWNNDLDLLLAYAIEIDE